MHINKLLFHRLLAPLALLGSGITPAAAQLEDLRVTEIMYNPVGNDTVYEWFEVMNLGSSTIDLAGYYIEDIGATVRSSAMPQVDPTYASNTTIGPGQIAVFYDAVINSTSPLNYDDEAFRTAWKIPQEAAIIALTSAPRLNNSTEQVGFWRNLELLGLDTDPDDDFDTGAEVIGFDHADRRLFYHVNGSGWPATFDGRSIEYDGTGLYAYGGNWRRSVSGVWGAVTSDPIYEPGAALKNDTDDFASPGVVPLLPAPQAGLIFTEIMYNPASPEPAWEWVEVYNNTGVTIDFAATPHVLDDDDDDDLAAPNLTSGVIPHGTTAVLFNAELNHLQDMQTAWGGGVNYIPVSDFTALGQSGDALGLWDDYSAYASEPQRGPGRTFEHVIASVMYENGGKWPSDNAASSIYLTDLSHGNSVIGGQGDFNGDGQVDAADYTLWRDNYLGDEATIGHRGDGDGQVDADDYAVWVENFGQQASAGFLWARSGDDDDALGFAATGVPGDVAPTLYEGGGVGSPGVYVPGPLSIPEPCTWLSTTLVFSLTRPGRRRP